MGVCDVFVAGVAQAQVTTDLAQLRALRTSWEASRKKALQPIDATYTQELQKLLDVLTKAGRLDALAEKALRAHTSGQSRPL